MKGSITISRPSYGDGREKIRICVRDKASRGEFCEILVDYADFAKALTGLSETPMDFTCRGLENVGKKRVVEQRRIAAPGDGLHKREFMQNWLLENAQEPGWQINSYLGSQSSITRDHDTGIYYLNYSVFKFVDAEEE